MSCVQHIRRMNENGVKKMCRNIFSLQQTLTNITLAREPALDYARQYFELLCLAPEVICFNFFSISGISPVMLDYLPQKFFCDLLGVCCIILNSLVSFHWFLDILKTCFVLLGQLKSSFEFLELYWDFLQVLEDVFSSLKFF